MKILLFDDIEINLLEMLKTCEDIYGEEADIIPVLINEQTKWQNLRIRLGNINFGDYVYVFSDVNMPTPHKTLELFFEMREDGFYAPIFLISSDCKNPIIPNDILGLNVSEKESLYRRHQDSYPSLDELIEAKPFISKEQIPNRRLSKLYLTALHILCQGYLAVHGMVPKWKEVETDADIVASRKEKTDSKEWWKIIIESNDIDGELITVESKNEEESKAKADIKKLVTYLRGETLEEQKLSPLVKQAYDALCILEARRFL